MKFEDLLEARIVPTEASNVLSMCTRLEVSQFEQELRNPLAPGNAYFGLGWEKLIGGAAADPTSGQYQYVIDLATPSVEIGAALHKIGAKLDGARQAWTLPLLSRTALKNLLESHRDLLSYLTEDAVAATASKMLPLAVALELPADTDAAQLRAARLSEATYRTEGLLALADFMRQHGQYGKVRDVASLDGRRSLHFARHDNLGKKDQVLVYDYLKKRIWWCAGTHPDSYASFLPVSGGQAVLTFMEQYHVSRGVRVKVPTAETLQTWFATCAE